MIHSPYNIDALRVKGGGYRNASAKFIRGALRCGHTAHLQTRLGTIAIRPYTIDEVRTRPDGSEYFPGERAGRNWLVEFYPTPHLHGNEYALRTNDLIDAIGFAYGHLNGELGASYTAGQQIEVYANQASRDAEVLAVLGEEVLVEYTMPGTTSGRESSSLRVLKAIGTLEYGNYTTYPHRRLPRKWVEAMHDQGTEDWIGLGQRESEPVPFPA